VGAHNNKSEVRYKLRNVVQVGNSARVNNANENGKFETVSAES